MAELDPASEYRNIRDEIRAEHSLIANRLSWNVTSQSFLVTAFAISRGSGFQWHMWFSTILLPTVGFTLSILIFPSVVGACETIRLWHRKQALFFENHPDFKAAFALQRASWIESQGFLFPKLMPALFCILWGVIAVASHLPR